MGPGPVVDDLELETQVTTLLPPRETLYSFGGVNVNVAPVIGVNLAFAINAATINSNASALAAQTLAVYLP